METDFQALLLLLVVVQGPGFNITVLDHAPPLTSPYYLSVYCEHHPRAGSDRRHMGGQNHQAPNQVVYKATLASHLSKEMWCVPSLRFWA